MTPHNLSLSDLVLIERFSKAFGERDSGTIEQILFENGLDTTQQYEEVVCTHRNLQGNIVTCMRYEGVERSCDYWLKKSGAASWEAIVENCELDLRIDLKNMSQNYSNTAHIVNELEKHNK